MRYDCGLCVFCCDFDFFSPNFLQVTPCDITGKDAHRRVHRVVPCTIRAWGLP